MVVLAPLLATVGYVSAQNGASTAPFTDPATGISFQAYTNGGFKFGVALPKTGSKDLIGLLACAVDSPRDGSVHNQEALLIVGQSATKASTYAGGVLGPTMNNTILIVAWPYGDTMLGSIRKVPAGNRPHAAPPEFTTDVSLKTIPKGTFVTPSGDWQYTFLCSGCLDRKDVYPGTAGKESFAWALSKDPLREPANRTGRLNHHHAGSGRFTAYMTAARHVAFPQWAKLAA